MLRQVEELCNNRAMKHQLRIKNSQLLLPIWVIPFCVFVRKTIPHAIITTTTVRMAVARLELTPWTPIFASIEVRAANMADNSAKINHLVDSSYYFYCCNYTTIERGSKGIKILVCCVKITGLFCHFVRE